MQPGGQPFDMQALLEQAQQMQQAVMEAQAEIANAVVSSEAGGGLVQLTIKATGEVQSLVIDPKVVDPEDVDTLQDLITGAFNSAMMKAQELAQEKFGPFAGGQMPGLAG